MLIIADTVLDVAFDASIRCRLVAENTEKQMSLLDEQICVVTGAGQGLGRAVALEMAAEGAVVALLEINAETLNAVATEIAGKGGTARTYRLDITDYESYGRVIDDLIARFGLSLIHI